MTASRLRFAAMLYGLMRSKNLSAVSTELHHFSTSSGLLLSLNKLTNGTIDAWNVNHTAFQPDMRSAGHLLEISSMVFAAIMRHFPTMTFSSALRPAKGVRRRAVDSST